MTMLGSIYQVFELLAFLLIFASVCVAFPVQTSLEVQPEALFDGSSNERTDGLDLDPWSSYREKPTSVEVTNISIPDDMSSTSEDPEASSDKNVDPLSLVYYIGSFAALLLFFLVVSCSECCCEKPPTSVGRATADNVLDDCLPPDAGTPPPPYDDFAPPPYNSLFESEDSTKSKLTVFVVPVQNTDRVPP
ncbi:uncharacterized protein [Anabrus simplex]|uniref:uncharacterized protein n=1 Tax=Anabrus simplex TaxID=316456 RepID=UPI0034DD9A3E